VVRDRSFASSECKKFMSSDITEFAILPNCTSVAAAVVNVFCFELRGNVFIVVKLCMQQM